MQCATRPQCEQLPSQGPQVVDDCWFKILLLYSYVTVERHCKNIPTNSILYTELMLHNSYYRHLPNDAAAVVVLPEMLPTGRTFFKAPPPDAPLESDPVTCDEGTWAACSAVTLPIVFGMMEHLFVPAVLGTGGLAWATLDTGITLVLASTAEPPPMMSSVPDEVVPIVLVTVALIVLEIEEVVLDADDAMGAAETTDDVVAMLAGAGGGGGISAAN
jgi:hypothetical protein